MRGFPTDDEWSRLRNESPSGPYGQRMPGNLSVFQGLLPLAVASAIEDVRWEDWPSRLARIDAIKQRWEDEGRSGFSEAILCRTPGQTAREFSDLATVLGIMAFAPGGVRAFGLHWEETE